MSLVSTTCSNYYNVEIIRTSLMTLKKIRSIVIKSIYSLVSHHSNAMADVTGIVQIHRQNNYP